MAEQKQNPRRGDDQIRMALDEYVNAKGDLGRPAGQRAALRAIFVIMCGGAQSSAQICETLMRVCSNHDVRNDVVVDAIEALKRTSLLLNA